MTTTYDASPIRHPRPRKAPVTRPFKLEKDLAVACAKRIAEWGGYAFNVHGGGAAQKTGQPDLLACIRGRLIAVELKRVDATKPYPTDLQYKRLREWRDAGGLAGWATSVVELDRILELGLDDPDWENPQLLPASIAAHDRNLEAAA